MKEKEYLTLDVKYINKRWSAQLKKNGLIIDSMSCKLKADIGWICREMLRWHDKLGGTSPMAMASRARGQSTLQQGKVYYGRSTWNKAREN